MSTQRLAARRYHLTVVAAAATLLASAPLMSLFEGLGWMFRAAFAIAMIAAAAAGTRALRAPDWAQVLAMFGALLLAVTWMFGSGGELLGLLPTPETFAHFGSLLGEVPDDVAAEAIPVSDREGLLLLTTLGVGVVAILVDILVVGLRRPALAGLPMLAIYSVPVAVHRDSVPAFTFIIGVLGFLWLVGADNLSRVRRFGRRFTGDGRDVEPWEPSPLAAAGRRLTVVGLVAAVLLPLVVPGMTTGLVDRFGPGLGDGEGEGGDPTAVNLLATLDGLLNRDSTEELVRFSTDDPDPFYLRVGVADLINEDGFGNRPPGGEPVTGAIPAPDRNAPGVTYGQYHVDMDVLSFNMSRAPTFADLVGVAGLSDQWRYDPEQRVVFSVDEGASGLEYGFDYVRATYNPEALRQAPELAEDHPMRQQFGDVLENDEITARVEELTADAATPYDRVLAIRNYFSRANGFRYSLETGSDTSAPAIVDFVIVNKQGFCVQYATAMAWLVREVGLPARVVVGFTRGSQRTTEGGSNVYVLTNHNLHAWTEVYFDGFGWVPFDPTPSTSIAGAVEQDWDEDPNAPNPSDPNNPTNTPGPTASPGTSTPNPLFPDDEQGTLGGGADQGSSGWQVWAVAGAGVLLGLLAAPGLTRAQLRRRRLRNRPADRARESAHAAWDELLDTLVDYRVRLDSAETPRTTAERVVRECRLDVHRTSPAADGVRLLGHAEERARYARTPLPAGGLVTAVRALRRALAEDSTIRTRARAGLLPPSTLLRWRIAIGDLIARVALAGSRIGEQLARLSPRRLVRTAR